jgi:hypothetical protein
MRPIEYQHHQMCLMDLQLAGQWAWTFGMRLHQIEMNAESAKLMRQGKAVLNEQIQYPVCHEVQ